MNSPSPNPATTPSSPTSWSTPNAAPTASSTSAPEPGWLPALFEGDHHRIDAGLARYRAAATAGPVDADSAAALADALQALKQHIWLEEEHLFPPLAGTGVTAALLVMLREHAQIWTTIGTLEAGLEAGADAAGTLHALEVELQHHNLKEERIIYPAADELLSADDHDRLREVVATGAMPLEWLPIRAR